MATFKTYFGFSSARVGTQLDVGKTSSYITLSNANLTATRNAGTPYYVNTLSESSALTGELYVEVTNTAVADAAIGIANGPLADDDWLGFDTNSIGLFADTVWYNNALVGAFTTPSLATDVIGVWINRDVPQVWFTNTRTNEWLPDPAGPGFDVSSFGTGPLYFGFSLSYPDSKTVNFDGAFVLADTGAAVRWDGSEIVGAAAYTLTADAGAVTVAGSAATLARSYVMSAATGAVALAGVDAGLKVARRLTADAGAVVVTRNDAGLVKTGTSPVMPADTGAVVVSGKDAALNLRRVYSMIAAPGGIVVTRYDAALSTVANKEMVAATGAIVVSGKAAALSVVRKLPAATGPILLTGINVNLIHGVPAHYAMSVAPGAITVSQHYAELIAAQRERQPGRLNLGRRATIPHRW